MMARHSQISHGAHRQPETAQCNPAVFASINQGWDRGAATDRRGYRKKKSA